MDWFLPFGVWELSQWHYFSRSSVDFQMAVSNSEAGLRGTIKVVWNGSGGMAMQVFFGNNLY